MTAPQEDRSRAVFVGCKQNSYQQMTCPVKSVSCTPIVFGCPLVNILEIKVLLKTMARQKQTKVVLDYKFIEGESIDKCIHYEVIDVNILLAAIYHYLSVKKEMGKDGRR